MAFCRNHSFLYFDKLRRTEKAEAVLCLIHASYQADIKGGTKEDVARMLKNAYELFRFSAGTYSGDSESQFSSQYTIGLELGIWINSDLKLCPLAIKVAQNEITITDYFDIFFLNYIQPIDGKICHLLLMTLEYAKSNNQNTISKTDLKNIFSFVSEAGKNDINGLFNMFIGSSYFKKIDENTLSISYPIDDILKCCNKECLNKKLSALNEEFSDLQNYVAYLTKDHRSLTLIIDKLQLIDGQILTSTINSNNSNSKKAGINKIYYGIPGCGKSYYVENTELKDVDKEHDVFRTTFYLDYSNSDFIGQIYPHVDEYGNVSYVHVPGPFTKALERALTVEDGRMVYLIIEEINRGNAAAIFGDTFQLLDRVKEKTEGKEIGDSEYPISNSFIEGYFKKNDIPFTHGQIYIPHNLTIFATMNTSDQNVFPLDTAFKRRWDREMVSAEWGNVSFRNMYVPGTNITWEKFCTTINKKMLEPSADSDVAVSEDKQIGAFFVQKNMLCDVPNEKSHKKLISFTGNIIDYLYNDVTKFDHSILFAKEFLSYNSVYDEITNYYVNAISEPNNNTNAGPFEKVFKREVIDELLNNKSSVEDLQDEQGNQN